MSWAWILILKSIWELIEKIIHLRFQAFNKEAEYEASIYKLSEVHKLGATRVKLFAYSKHMVS